MTGFSSTVNDLDIPLWLKSERQIRGRVANFKRHFENVGVLP